MKPHAVEERASDQDGPSWLGLCAFWAAHLVVFFTILSVAECNADRKDERESLALAVENELSELRGLIETNARAIRPSRHFRTSPMTAPSTNTALVALEEQLTPLAPRFEAALAGMMPAPAPDPHRHGFGRATAQAPRMRPPVDLHGRDVGGLPRA